MEELLHFIFYHFAAVAGKETVVGPLERILFFLKSGHFFHFAALAGKEAAMGPLL